MSNNTRRSANLVSETNIFSDIINNAVGIGSSVPTSKLTVQGNVLVSGILTSTSVIATNLDGSLNVNNLIYDSENEKPFAFGYLSINTNKTSPQYGELSFTKVIDPNEDIDIFELDIYADYIGPGSFSINENGFLTVVL